MKKNKTHMGLFDKIMVKFMNWFQSPAAVIQIFVFTTLWAIAIKIWPGIDPNAFFFLFVCTVWSVQTQNVLAYGSSISARKAEENSEHLVELSSQMADQLEILSKISEDNSQLLHNSIDQMGALYTIVDNLIDMMKKLETVVNKMNVTVENIEDISEDIMESVDEDKENA